MDINALFNYTFIKTDNFSFTFVDLLTILTTIIIAYLFLFTIRKTILGKNSRFQKDNGNSLALYQIIKYIVVVVSIVVVLESIGVKVTLLLAGSAALLVGLGLGLQHIFNDVVSGIILLIEHHITVDDIIEVDGMVVQVKKIGLRTSEVETRDDIIIILPNSRLVSESIINWSHNRDFTRFKITLGVAYGSDVELVKRILKQCVEAHPDVTRSKEPKVRFTDFGDSALLFDVLFWSNKMFRIEEVKSDIRIDINKRLKESGIQIPFPQRDIHIKSDL